ncbi:MAG: hypothetical protein KJ645_02560 [Planctomycetes bacterium]|nr:hypothetical protein [Planctomycetota bacterium]
MRYLYGGLQPSEIPGLKAARTLYRSIGVDPTRMRPASEALMRRVLKGDSLPKINSAVDAMNLVSLRHMIPVGLYDFAKIHGGIELRLGKEGEQYGRIGSGEIHLEGRLGLFDESGGFGNPTGDSRRTCVGEGTTALLFVAFYPADFDPDQARRMILDAAEVLTRHTGGTTRMLGEAGLVGW